MSKICLARADTPRAVLALAFPPAAWVLFILILWSKGYGPFDFFTLLQSGELSWFRLAVGLAGTVIWIARYYPPALSAVADGPCLVSEEGDELLFPGKQRLRREEIKSVHLERGLFRKAARIETATGHISLPLIFVRPSSDSALRSLATFK